jgi:hypothetical protein
MKEETVITPVHMRKELEVTKDIDSPTTPENETENKLESEKV